MRNRSSRWFERPALAAAIAWALGGTGGVFFLSARAADMPRPAPFPQAASAPAQSTGCLGCHRGAKDPHTTPQGISCVDCHGGQGAATRKEDAHPRPRRPEAWKSAANPHGSFTLLNAESREWIRFVNPGDLRTADLACGKCHAEIVRAVRKSPMVGSAQVYSTALYNNGSVPFKDAAFVEQYSVHGEPQAVRTIPPPTPEETRLKGILPILFPLPRFEIGQSGTFFRPFERGGGPKSELGNPNREDIPGQPDVTVTNRGFGTQASVDPVILGAQKTRLNDPVMSFLGTNDSPGDYRSSGCTSCHVVYANDRDPFNSAHYARFGNRGLSVNEDPTVQKGEPGHPIKHEFTRAIPSSQCITCHVHNGNGFLNSYLGYMWWDQQTEGEHLYPKAQRDPTEREINEAARFNPEEAAARGLWHDARFLETLSELNPKLRKAQFSDYHGHGWVFSRVYKRDRKGSYLDAEDRVIPFDDPDLWKRAVHLKDIHLEKGMHCVDCHFKQDSHGNAKLYGDRRAAIEIDCQDCHGTVAKPATLVTSGPASPGTDLSTLSTPFGEPRFSSRRGRITQRSMVTEGLAWEVPQVVDSVTPGHPRYNERSRLAKTIQKDGSTWGNAGADPRSLAHAGARMACFTCHSAWTTNCFGCHLGARVATKMPMLHNEGTESQVYASYNPQVLRSDGYMLAVDGTVLGNRIAPARSSSSVVVSVQNANREWVVNHATTISAAGYNGNAFNTFVPHTVRGRETKSCTDCHVSRSGDNNAWMASLLMLGTNQVNFMGRFIYVAEGDGGFSAVTVAERDEPQAVFGSHLHALAYPGNHARHQADQGRLRESARHGGQARQVQLYGEYLLAAGKDGFRVYDVANVGNKGFSQGIVTGPFASQTMKVSTADAAEVAVASNTPLDPKRIQLPANEERPVAPLFGYALIADRVEGLITVDITTLSDGIPTNNRLRRAATYNPEGRLSGAGSITIAGNYAYVTTASALQVVHVSDPRNPRWVAAIGPPEVKAPRRIAVQFRYGFLCDAEGLKVVDLTSPSRPRVVPGALVPLAQASDVYLSRTYAYVAAGADGLAIVDIERPEQPRLDQTFKAGGSLNDARNVKVGMVNASLFAYVADGRNGLKVIELTSPETVPGNQGFSPRPAPRQVAHAPTSHPALSISEGNQRDRGVDESGNQIAVFGRRGARPFTLEEQQRLYLRDGKLYTVTEQPPAPPR